MGIFSTSGTFWCAHRLTAALTAEEDKPLRWVTSLAGGGGGGNCFKRERERGRERERERERGGGNRA